MPHLSAQCSVYLYFIIEYTEKSSYANGTDTIK